MYCRSLKDLPVDPDQLTYGIHLFQMVKLNVFSCSCLLNMVEKIIASCKLVKGKVYFFIALRHLKLSEMSKNRSYNINAVRKRNIPVIHIYHN